jgi:dienelactone hydrolase
MLSKTIKTFLIIKIFLILFITNTFAENITPLQKGKFEFDTYYTFDFSRLTSGVYKDDKLKGKGELYLPKSLKKDDKIPLVIILHTSGGIKSNREVRYAKYLNKNGYASFIIDTYGTRKCNASGSGWKNCISKISVLDFATDAYMALNLLSSHPNIDNNKISLFGFSYGGDAAMLSLDLEIKNMFSPDAKPFDVVVSIYGACNNIFDISKTIGSDFYYIVGSKDISYDRVLCLEIQDQLKKAGSKYEEFIIEGAVSRMVAGSGIEPLTSGL